MRSERRAKSLELSRWRRNLMETTLRNRYSIIMILQRAPGNPPSSTVDLAAGKLLAAVAFTSRVCHCRKAALLVSSDAFSAPAKADAITPHKKLPTLLALQIGGPRFPRYPVSLRIPAMGLISGHVDAPPKATKPLFPKQSLIVSLVRRSAVFVAKAS